MLEPFNGLFCIFETFSSLRRYVQFNDIHKIVHAAEYPFLPLEKTNNSSGRQILKINIAFIVYLTNGLSSLHLVKNIVDFVGKMVVGLIS